MHPSFKRQISPISSTFWLSERMSVINGRTSTNTLLKLSQFNMPALLETEGFPLPFCNSLFSTSSFHCPAVQVTPSLALTPVLAQLQSSLMQFTIPAELYKSPTPHPTLFWKQARIPVGSFSRIGRHLSALNWFKCSHEHQSQLKGRGEDRMMPLPSDSCKLLVWLICLWNFILRLYDTFVGLRITKTINWSNL